MQPISAFRRLGAVNCRVRPPAAARGARYAVAEDARRGDPCLKPPGIRGMSVKMTLALAFVKLEAVNCVTLV
jgi:hypothetical protein